MSLRHRRSPRLQGYDYSQEGASFLTICNHERRHLFGMIQDGRVILSALGEIAAQELQQLPSHWPTIILDVIVVMPNHVHAIVVLSTNAANPQGASPTLGQIVGNYKGGVTRLARQRNLTDVEIWQGRYHDHIIRNEKAFETIQAYIMTNPERWQNDVFYTAEM